ncbi:hypothetical protein [Actinomadura luteofluorescens]|uniref:hypothetical protein n=1 Tax=Actinomadura luteofluorescens TaxID=46163 RepID=UPI003D92E126
MGAALLHLAEFAFGALDVGIPIDDMLTTLEMLNGYVERAARGEIEWMREMHQDAMTPERAERPTSARCSTPADTRCSSGSGR